MGGIATAVLYAGAPARAVTPWLLGWALAFTFELSVATGVFTGTETAGLVALLAIAIALPLRLLTLRHTFAPMLRQLGTETIAITSCLAAAICISALMTKIGIPDAVAGAAGSGFAMIALVAVGYLVLAYLLTPILTLALLPFLFEVFKQVGLHPAFAGAVLLLLGAAAAIARAGRSRSEAPDLSLSRRAAWILAAFLAGVAVAAGLLAQTLDLPAQQPLR